MRFLISFETLYIYFLLKENKGEISKRGNRVIRNTWMKLMKERERKEKKIHIKVPTIKVLKYLLWKKKITINVKN